MGIFEIAGIGFGVLFNNAIWIFIFRMFLARIKTVEEKMVEKDECGYKHSEVVKRLDKSDTNTKDINEKFGQIMVAIGEIKVEVKNLKDG